MALVVLFSENLFGLSDTMLSLDYGDESRVRGSDSPLSRAKATPDPEGENASHLPSPNPNLSSVSPILEWPLTGQPK